mmetsp:Transcript_14708/g.34920  ORF Transcript_14708/g.34920 Transcript_14708/m.34920 type:complete len:211 (-) Transcript_14708:670-1302(-)
MTLCGCCCAALVSSISRSCRSVFPHRFSIPSSTSAFENASFAASWLARQKMLVSPPIPTTETPGTCAFTLSQAGGSPMAFLNSRTRACAWGIETGLGDAVVLKLFPCTCSIRTEVAMPDPIERIQDRISPCSTLVIWKDPPPESQATRSVAAVVGQACVAVRKPIDPSCCCEMILRSMPSARTCLRNSGPLVALRNAAVAAPANCSAPFA